MGKTHSKPLAARHGRGTAYYVGIGLYLGNFFAEGVNVFAVNIALSYALE
jgi:hypothetical protein